MANELKELGNISMEKEWIAQLIIDSTGKVIKDRFGICKNITRILVVK